jgi:hypothetical protein
MQSASSQLPHETLDPIDALDLNTYTQALRAKCLPKGACEEDAFEAYATAAFLAKQTRIAEVEIMRKFLSDPNDRKSIQQVATVQHIGQCYDRRARQSFESLRKLQRDRLVSQALTEELVSHKVAPPPIPASMPLASIQTTTMHKNRPLYTAILLYADHIASASQTADPQAAANLRNLHQAASLDELQPQH